MNRLAAAPPFPSSASAPTARPTSSNEGPPLRDEALQPADRGALVPRGRALKVEHAQAGRVFEAQPAKLARGTLRASQIAIRDGSGEASVCARLPLGPGDASLVELAGEPR